MVVLARLWGVLVVPQIQFIDGVWDIRGGTETGPRPGHSGPHSKSELLKELSRRDSEFSFLFGATVCLELQV